ncbi:Conserved_hypothetical protein [Hexamita inflata]|uniref:Uncharacterized protein n=1 Tax=Hexamita inflata TaxID=28002 RepID=A0ABP1HJ19_9EUKA
MNWNFPAYLYVGNQTMYSVQLIMRQSTLEFFECSCKKILLTLDYFDIKLHIDRNTETVFRIKSANRVLILTSTFRKQIVHALQLYNSLMQHNPHLIPTLSPECQLRAPVLVDGDQMLLFMNASSFQLYSDLGQVVFDLNYTDLTDISYNSCVTLNVKNGFKIQIDVVEPALEPLIHCCIQARYFIHSQKPAEIQIQELSLVEADLSYIGGGTELITTQTMQTPIKIPKSPLKKSQQASPELTLLKQILEGSKPPEALKVKPTKRRLKFKIYDDRRSKRLQIQSLVYD